MVGERNAIVNAHGQQKIIVDRVEFDLFQTPTEVSYEVFNLGDIQAQINAYTVWIKSLDLSLQEMYDDYEDEIDACLNGPSPAHKISFINPGDKHINDLSEFITMCNEEAYTVKFFVM
jgi:hypothetical protein